MPHSVHSLSLCLYSCPENGYISTIFLDSIYVNSVQFSHSVMSNSLDCSTPDFPIHHQFLELAQMHDHRVIDATQPSHPLLSPSPPAFNLSQHQGLFLMSQFFPSGGLSVGASASASVLPMKGLMCCSVQFSCSVMSDSLQPHGLQHTRLPCPSPIPEAYSNLCPLSQ